MPRIIALVASLLAGGAIIGAAAAAPVVRNGPVKLNPNFHVVVPLPCSANVSASRSNIWVDVQNSLDAPLAAGQTIHFSYHSSLELLPTLEFGPAQVGGAHKLQAPLNPGQWVHVSGGGLRTVITNCKATVTL